MIDVPVRARRRRPAPWRGGREHFERLLALIDRERERLAGLLTSVPEDRLIDHVADWLYTTWYTVPHFPNDGLSPNFQRHSLVPILRNSLPASTRWTRGWVVTSTKPGGICVAGQRGRALRELRPGEYANTSRPAMPVAPGDAVAVCERIDYVDDRTGFWGTHAAAGEPEPPLLRLYWSVTADRIGAVLSRVATALDDSGIRYALKAPAHSVDYARVDSLVVYIGRTDWRRFKARGQQLAAELQPLLRASVPPFTHPLAPGVAVADDVGSLMSFGQSRCRAIASGVLDIIRTSTASPTQKRSFVIAALTRANIDAHTPWRAE